MPVPPQGIALHAGSHHPGGSDPLPGIVAVVEYTGDGAINRDIVGVGFDPKGTVIYDAVTGAAQNPNDFQKFTNYTTDSSLQRSDRQSYGSRLEALIADGFTVDDGGIDADPNKSGVDYVAICYR